MTRTTSIEAYNTIKENGLLSKRRWEVYDVVFRHGPITANETFVVLQEEGRGSYNAASNSAARFSELREAGVIFEVGTVQCKVTGMQVIQWDVTGRLPKAKTLKPKAIKCKHCNGKGYHLQERLL